MSMKDLILEEFAQEAKTTRRLLERVPDDKLDWQPHEKSMNLGRLSGHMAENPSWGVSILEQDEIDIGAGEYEPFVAESRDGILEAFDDNVAAVTAALKKADDDLLAGIWRLRNGDEVMLEAPRGAIIKSWLVSHMVHHRGQLSVYLRLLDVPVPSIYGPSADETDG